MWGAALLQPILLGFVMDAERSTAEITVKELVRSQSTRFDSGTESYVLFDSTIGGMSQGFTQLNLSVPEQDSSFLYETAKSVAADGTERVFVRARPSNEAMSKTLFPLPPMVYEYELGASKGGGWNAQGRTKPKLYGLF